MSSVRRTRYGIGEWYGKQLNDLSFDTKIEYAEAKGINNFPCPFQLPNKLCNKAGGVCTLAKYAKTPAGKVIFDATQELVTTCPNRFLEDRIIFREVGKELLDDNSPFIIKEVPFLKGIDYKGAKLKNTVGRIDMVLAKTKGAKLVDWCALEMQAVYFSGASMKKDFRKIYENPEKIQFPTG